ncbi:MAG: hypothetical protein EA411_01210 [Saprospirales bacterium]|nr:MAG: hypothetical protein EA411_01210 [Saprospirales bacterium]
MTHRRGRHERRGDQGELNVTIFSQRLLSELWELCGEPFNSEKISSTSIYTTEICCYSFGAIFFNTAGLKVVKLGQ